MLQRTIDILKSLNGESGHGNSGDIAANAYARLAQMMRDHRRPPRPGKGQEGDGLNFGPVLKDVVTMSRHGVNPTPRRIAVAIGQGQHDRCRDCGRRKRNVAIQTMVPVRDKVIAAYEEILRMPI